AMSMLPRTHPLRLLIIGPEPAPEEMDAWGQVWREFKEQGRLFCTGWQPRAEALKIAAAGDLVLMPSLQDGLANGLLEGMALNLCPVASDIFSDVLADNETGFLVARGDALKWSRILDHTATHPEVRRRIATAAGRLIARRYSPQRETNDY